MPEQYLIRFHDLPKQIYDHIEKRIIQRKITPEDLAKWRYWASTNPSAPEGDWYKDFGTYKLVGRGAYPHTVLSGEMKAWGTKLAYLKVVEDFLGDRSGNS